MQPTEATLRAVREFWFNLPSVKAVALAKQLKIKANPYSGFDKLPKKSRDAIIKYMTTK